VGVLELIEQAQDAGLTLWMDGDALKISGPESAEPLARQVGEHKNDVLKILAPAPYLTEDGELRIPLNTLPRYRWWQEGQSIWAALAELDAPLLVWRRHAANRGEFLHSPEHAEWCGGEAQTGDGFAFCVECGGYAEIQQSK
jgi:hypothetical protein